MCILLVTVPASREWRWLNKLLFIRCMAKALLVKELELWEVRIMLVLELLGAEQSAMYI